MFTFVEVHLSIWQLHLTYINCNLNYIIPDVNQEKETHLFNMCTVDDHFCKNDCHTQKDVDIGWYPIYIMPNIETHRLVIYIQLEKSLVTGV